MDSLFKIDWLNLIIIYWPSSSSANCQSYFWKCSGFQNSWFPLEYHSSILMLMHLALKNFLNISVCILCHWTFYDFGLSLICSRYHSWAKPFFFIIWLGPWRIFEAWIIWLLTWSSCICCGLSPRASFVSRGCCLLENSWIMSSINFSSFSH